MTSSNYSRQPKVLAPMVPLLLCSCLLLVVGCRTDVVHDLSEQDANKFLSRLNHASIVASKDRQSDGRWSLSVADSDVMLALNFLESSRLFLPQQQDVGDATGGILAGANQSQLGYEHAKAAEIAKSLQTIQGVLQAQVHLHLPTPDPLVLKAQSAPSGSIILVVTPYFDVSKEEIAGVVGGAAGVRVDAIEVLIGIENLNAVPVASPKIEEAVKNSSSSETIGGVLTEKIASEGVSSMPLVGSWIMSSSFRTSGIIAALLIFLVLVRYIFKVLYKSIDVVAHPDSAAQ